MSHKKMQITSSSIFIRNIPAMYDIPVENNRNHHVFKHSKGERKNQ